MVRDNYRLIVFSASAGRAADTTWLWGTAFPAGLGAAQQAAGAKRMAGVHMRTHCLHDLLYAKNNDFGAMSAVAAVKSVISHASRKKFCRYMKKCL